MATVNEITHDAGGAVTDYWTPPGGTAGLSITVAAALGGSVEGLEIDETSLAGGSTLLRDSFATLTGNDLRMRCRVNFDNATQPGGVGSARAFLFQVEDTTRANAEIGIQENNASADTWDVEFFVREDGQIPPQTQIGATTTITGDTCLELRVVRATTNVSLDGVAEAYINGVSIGTDITLDNFDIWASDPPDRFELTIVQDANWGGTVYVDEFILDDDSTTALCVAVFAPTLAPMTKPVDVDADGSNLYLALLDSGNPILIKMSTALNADGSTVFSPGAGDDIGVQCGRFDADVVWVAGAFDGTNVVEKSEDGGTTFTVKDPATFGDVEAFVVGPDSDTRVLIADDNIDIQETIDGGTVWTAINSGTGFNVNAIARLPQNVQESVFGNDANATDNIDYSPNSGGDMEDFSTGFPTEDTTRVIVN